MKSIEAKTTKKKLLENCKNKKQQEEVKKQIIFDDRLRFELDVTNLESIYWFIVAYIFYSSISTPKADRFLFSFKKLFRIFYFSTTKQIVYVDFIEGIIQCGLRVSYCKGRPFCSWLLYPASLCMVVLWSLNRYLWSPILLENINRGRWFDRDLDIGVIQINY